MQSNGCRRCADKGRRLPGQRRAVGSATDIRRAEGRVETSLGPGLLGEGLGGGEVEGCRGGEER